jgi:hypothetical protein
MKKFLFVMTALGFLGLSTGAQAHDYVTTVSQKPLITLSFGTPAPVLYPPRMVQYYAPPRQVGYVPVPKYVAVKKPVPYGQWKKDYRHDGWQHTSWRRDNNRGWGHDRDMHR